MPSADDQVVAMLRNKGLRHTGPRVAVMEVLLEAGCPLTHHQIAERLGSEAPNKTTIYRILMSLVKTNLVHKVFLQEREWYFELAHHCSEHQCHPHFTCTRCQRTECLHDVSIPLVELPEGMTLLRQQIRIQGLCSRCSHCE